MYISSSSFSEFCLKGIHFSKWREEWEEKKSLPRGAEPANFRLPQPLLQTALHEVSPTLYLHVQLQPV